MEITRFERRKNSSFNVGRGSCAFYITGRDYNDNASRADAEDRKDKNHS